MAVATQSQIRVQFTSTVPSIKLPKTPFAVPSSVTDVGLTKVVRHLLKQDSRRFEFLVVEDNELLKTSLVDHLTRHNRTSEDLVVLNVLPSIPDPQEDLNLQVPDWISSIDARCESLVFVGCYDGKLRGYDAGGSPSVQLSGHRGPIKAVSAHENTTGARPLLRCVTASKDRTLLQWQVSMPLATDAAGEVKSWKLAKAVGHEESVEAVCMDPSGEMFCSGGWDGMLRLWRWDSSSQTDEEAEGGPRKRAKRRHAPERCNTSVAKLSGHTRCISSVKYGQSSSKHIATGSWDHSVRLWDAERCCSTLTINTSKVVTCVALPSTDAGLVAASHPDHAVRLWDSRAGGTAVVRLTLGGHSKWVSSVSFSPVRPSCLVSTGHDGTLKLWDLRSSSALHTNEAEKGNTLLACAWNCKDQIFSGGKSGKFRRFTFEK